LIRTLEGTILKHMSREELHQLVDTLPELAMEQARKMLERLQTWPPQVPPEVKQRLREGRERLQGLAPKGHFGGGGGVQFGSQGEPRNGCYTSSGFAEDGGTVRETQHFLDGLKVAITERTGLQKDRKALIYSSEIVGPDGSRHVQNITFQVKETSS